MPNSRSDLGSPRRLRSALAIVAPLAGTIVVTTATDLVFHSLGFYPPWGQPMWDTGDNLLALAYRVPFTILTGYAAARLAPRAPATHAAVLGVLGVGLTLGGTAVAKAKVGDVGPDWFWIILAASSLPLTLIGARLATRHRKAGPLPVA